MALTDKLTAIADGFRQSRGTEDKYSLDQMAVLAAEVVGSDPVIEPLSITSNGTYTATECDGYSPITVNVPQDGAPTAEELTFTGDLTNWGYAGAWNKIIDKYAPMMTFNRVSNMSSMLAYNNQIKEFPCVITCITQTTPISAANMFKMCQKLTTLPTIKNYRVGEIKDIFSQCYLLREVPDDWCDDWDWEGITNSTTAYSYGTSNLFSYCYSLRSFPNVLIENYNPYITYSNAPCYSTFQHCYVLDEIHDLGVPDKTAWTSNAFNYTFQNCHRVKRISFKLNPETNSPYVVQWKSQVIDLSSGIGYYLQSVSRITSGYNSGITADKEVTDDATYQALKDDPDWFTGKSDYSRYNKVSALETINSLPDTSAYGTNTIKFKGTAGAKTDGGAINTLTEAEIAVATEKGWTVTLT